jgi:hypothetical protein
MHLFISLGKNKNGIFEKMVCHAVMNVGCQQGMDPKNGAFGVIL